MKTPWGRPRRYRRPPTPRGRIFRLKLRAHAEARVEGAVLQFGPGATELFLEHLATEPWYARAARDWRVCRGWSSVLECLPPPA